MVTHKHTALSQQEFLITTPRGTIAPSCLIFWRTLVHLLHVLIARLDIDGALRVASQALPPPPPKILKTKKTTTSAKSEAACSAESTAPTQTDVQLRSVGTQSPGTPGISDGGDLLTKIPTVSPLFPTPPLIFLKCRITSSWLLQG